jgi:ribulose-bisphosphate carboxylase large chain
MSKKGPSSCEVPVKNPRERARRNRIYPFQKNFTWKGIPSGKYKTAGDDWSGIIRQVLIGSHGETAAFHLRYFEIEPGGYSSFEQHEHEHVVIAIRGRGKALLNRRVADLGYLDVLYIKPDAPHRLYNPYTEPFGFFCIVDAERDRPVSLEHAGAGIEGSP